MTGSLFSKLKFALMTLAAVLFVVSVQREPY